MFGYLFKYKWNAPQVSDDSDLSVYSDENLYEERPRGGDSPMEIKNYFPSPFVRHGFGRVSTASSSYQGSDNYNCVDEMSENEEKIITVKHCISKYNSVSGQETENASEMTTKNEEKIIKEESSEFRKKETTESKQFFFFKKYILCPKSCRY